MVLLRDVTDLNDVTIETPSEADAWALAEKIASALKRHGTGVERYPDKIIDWAADPVSVAPEPLDLWEGE